MLRLRALLVALCCAVTLSAAAARAQEPSILTHVHIDPAKPIDFHAYVTPETLFVGQQATYQVAVFLDDVAGSRLRRNPEFLPPEWRGLLAYDLGAPQKFGPHSVAGRQYTSHVFQKALFPLASGALAVPAPKLSYSMPQSTSYFSREETHVVSAESTTIVVRPLPVEGRPADFTGAVGVLKSSVRLDAATARIGDPLVLTLRVQGTGDVKLLPRPALEIEWASLVPGTERLQVDTSGPLVKGVKEFDWILTPSRDGAVSTPPIQYSYFNPYTRKYEVAEAEVVSLNVATGSLATVDSGDQAATVLPLRDHSVGVVSSALTERVTWWLLLVVVPVPALVLLMLSAPRKAPKQAPIENLRSLLQKPSSAAVSTRSQSPAAPVTPRDVRRLLLSSLSRRLDIPTDVLHERARTERLLLRRGVTRETTRELLTKLNALDVASFASGASDAAMAVGTIPQDVQSLTTDVLALYDRVDREALPPAGIISRKSKGVVKPIVATSLLLVLSSLHSVVARAQAANDTWASAVTAYKSRSYVEASEQFLRLATAEPRDADALANWGVASWAAGDTVSAVMAWQRAVRLDPLAADLREDMLLLPPGARDGVADIPMAPVPALAYSGALVWVCGWTALAFVLWRKRANQPAFPAVQSLAVVAILLGGVSSGAAVWGARQLRSVHLAVVVRPETMRAGPAAEADALGGAATGDIVRINRQAVRWAYVKHSDGRVGWLPLDHLASLTDTASK